MSRLSQDRLNILLAVVETSSFSKAGEQLGITASAVSQAISKLESQAGQALLRRTSRRVEVTAIGLALAERARALRDILHEADDLVFGESHAPDLRIGVTEDLAMTLLPECLGQLALEDAALRVDAMSAPALEKAFAAGQLDGMILKCRPGEAPADGEVLWRDRLSWGGADPAAVASLETFPVALLSGACRSRDGALEALRRWPKPWRLAASGPSLSGVLAAVRAGMALTALPATTMPRDLEIAGPQLNLPKLHDIDFVLIGGRGRAGSNLKLLGAALIEAVRALPPPKERPVPNLSLVRA